MMIDLPTQHVSRQFILPVALFDYFKRFQRSLLARTGQQYDNSQTLAVLMQEHRERIGLINKGRQCALLGTNLQHNTQLGAESGE